MMSCVDPILDMRRGGVLKGDGFLSVQENHESKL